MREREVMIRRFFFVLANAGALGHYVCGLKPQFCFGTQVLHLTSCKDPTQYLIIDIQNKRDICF